jgi:hypothetical protein
LCLDGDTVLWSTKALVLHFKASNTSCSLIGWPQEPVNDIDSCPEIFLQVPRTVFYSSKPGISRYTVSCTANIVCLIMVSGCASAINLFVTIDAHDVRVSYDIGRSSKNSKPWNLPF